MVNSRVRMLGVLACVAVATVPLVLSGCQLSDSPPSVSSPSPEPSPTEPVVPDDSPTEPVEPAEPGAEAAQVEVYWLSAADSQLELRPSKVALDGDLSTPEAQLKAGVERLLKGPANADVSSAIPQGTELKSLAVKPDGVHVDFSESFKEGGGSASMQGRLGQAIYTASSLDPQQSVWISIEGEPLTVLGGEGLEVSQPMTRSEFDKNFSL